MELKVFQIFVAKNSAVLRIFSVQLKYIYNPLRITRSSSKLRNSQPRDISVEFNNGGLARKSFMQFQDSVSLPRAIHIRRDKMRARARARLSGGKSKKVFFARLSPVDSRIHRATNQTEHLVHGTDPSGSRSGFLTAYPHPWLYSLLPLAPRNSLPLPPGAPSCPACHDILSLFTPWPPENTRDFLRISRNHGLRKVAEHVDRAPRCRVC